jgi:ATP-dependent helicase HrpA
MCRELFITHALVRHEYTTKGAFMAHNQRLADEAHRLRDKARRSDMFADEYEVFAFFDKRLPPTVHSGKTFEVWRAEAEARDPKILQLSLADLLLDEAHDLTPARFPDELVIAGVALPLRYRFEPSEDDDGITVTVPLAVLPQLDPEVMAATIPGWMHAKILALLESLPKALRKTLAPLDLRAAELASQIRAFQEPLLPAIERAIFEDSGERVGRDQWDLRSVPRHLHFTFEVIDPRDKVLGTSRDLAELQRSLGGRARELWAATPRASYERTGLRAWDFDALPASVTIEVGGRRMLAYPALVDTENAVDLRLLESQAAADAATRDGIRRLVLLQLGTSMTKLSAQLPGALAKDAQRAIVLRAIDEAFGLVADPPRDKAAFAARMSAGRAALPELLAQLGRLALDHSIELGRIQAALKPLVGKPGIARAVVEDVQHQLRYLAPPDLWRRAPLPRLHHILRYLRALTIRLQRQANDPQKDQAKAQSVVPLWQSFIAKHDELRAKGRTPRELEDFRWLLEELRVQVFAPELKTAIAVSLPRVQELWASLAR